MAIQRRDGAIRFVIFSMFEFCSLLFSSVCFSEFRSRQWKFFWGTIFSHWVFLYFPPKPICAPVYNTMWKTAQLPNFERCLQGEETLWRYVHCSGRGFTSHGPWQVKTNVEHASTVRLQMEHMWPLNLSELNKISWENLPLKKLRQLRLVRRLNLPSSTVLPL